MIIKLSCFPFLLALCASLTQASAHGKDYLAGTAAKLLKPLEGHCLQLHYSQNQDEFYHSFRPWQVAHSTSKGTAWAGIGTFVLADSPSDSRVTSVQYNDTELLLQEYWSNKVAPVSKQDFQEEPLDLARYNPAPLLLLFCYRHPSPESEDRNEAVYRLNINKNIVKLYLNKRTEMIDSVCIKEQYELLGDIERTITYTGYVQAAASPLFYPTTIYIDKKNKKLRDTVRVGPAAIVAQAPRLLQRPDGYTMGDEKPPMPELVTEKYNDHIHFITLKHTSGISMVVEFKDYLLVAEAPLSSANGELIIKEAGKISPGKPIKYFVFNHFHPDYLGGMRAFVHNGATVLCTDSDMDYVRYLATARHTMEPDSLELQPRPLLTEVINGSKTITDGAYEMKIYYIGAQSEHTNDYLVYYFPAEKLLFEGDLVWLPDSGAPQKASKRQAGLYKAIKSLGLDVTTIQQSWPTSGYHVKSRFSFAELQSSVATN